MEKFRKKALIEIVGLTPEGYLVQNDGDSSDQWVINPDVFGSTYEKVEELNSIAVGMTFKELLPDFIAGTPIKRKVWRGYWVYKYGKIEIHTKGGKVVNFVDTTDILFTISGILQDDWEVATNENCDITVN